jgi:hypothetical protein
MRPIVAMWVTASRWSGRVSVGTHATTVLDDPAERPLDHPHSVPRGESGAAGEPLDDLNPKGEYTFTQPSSRPG